MLSIIIPCYNCESTIEDCYLSILSSLQHNIIKEYEIILVNDGSSDKTLKKLDKIANTNKKVNVISQVNKGVSAARNLGISVAKGNWLSFIDSDDTVNKEFYKMLHNKNIDSDLIVCGVNSSIHPRLTGGMETLEREQYIKGILYNLNIFGYVCNKLYKREIIQANSIQFLENISFMEDKYFNLEYSLYTNNIKVVLENLYNYLEPTTSVLGNSDKKQTGLLVWDKLLNDPRFECYSDEFKKEKFKFMIWLLGQMYAEKAKGRGLVLEELKGERDYINSILSKVSLKYIQFKLLLLFPNLVGCIIRIKNRK